MNMTIWLQPALQWSVAFRNFELWKRKKNYLMKIYDGSSSICQLDDSNNKMNFAITHTV